MRCVCSLGWLIHDILLHSKLDFIPINFNNCINNLLSLLILRRVFFISTGASKYGRLPQKTWQDWALNNERSSLHRLGKIPCPTYKSVIIYANLISSSQFTPLHGLHMNTVARKMNTSGRTRIQCTVNKEAQPNFEHYLFANNEHSIRVNFKYNLQNRVIIIGRNKSKINGIRGKTGKTTRHANSNTTFCCYFAVSLIESV